MTSTPAPGGAGARTRAQRSEDSRARILDAAVACLIEGGYCGATTLTIQAAADVSRGRLLHHFPSRDRLLVAAAQHLAVKRVQDTEDRVLSIVGTRIEGWDRADRVVELLWESFHEPHFWAAVELWTAARANLGIAEVLRPEERRLGAVIKASVGRMFGEPLVSHPRFRQLRDLLLTSMRGTALTYTFDPRDVRHDPMVAQWKDLTRTLLA
ncbi:TetR/AcrR family transcriptional regulator [Pseudonocardia asaccharolytica]|uniref:TetR family transcriptional regulator n=1 Tax=Pseudonocardia asaccharolytica DSM 44247 = NBRC 16224 TaxID=1123024 RepID=A0A511CYI3_9PSEU|nr:TetR/AcrR family transcriptional regulator [Pseudonocardia asaccharolytica]GEL17537.1 TetR family transcriptional regulator [Pseudonocardia asaccharolytica DSM 44247 = NBRC 16224]